MRCLKVAVVFGCLAACLMAGAGCRSGSKCGDGCCRGSSPEEVVPPAAGQSP